MSAVPTGSLAPGPDQHHHHHHQQQQHIVMSDGVHILFCIIKVQIFYQDSREGLLRRTGGDVINIGFKTRDTRVPPEFKWLKTGVS
jgi:hypothetical protein